MIVKCICNRPRDLAVLNEGSFVDFYVVDTELPLTVGKEYVAYAISTFHGHIVFYVCDDKYNYYPMGYPADLFKVVEGGCSRHWRVNYFPAQPPEHPEPYPIISFGEWASDMYFYDKLIDREELQVKIFREYKKILDAEVQESQPG